MIILNRIITILVAFVLDQVIKDPPNKYHPVGWMGTFISRLRELTPNRKNLGKFIHGGLVILCGAALFGGAGLCLQLFTDVLSSPMNWLISALLLNFFFTVRGLKTAANEVQKPLISGDLNKARRAASFHMVNRNTDEMNESQIAAAAIESVAENSCDSIVAPLLYYLVAGLPGVIIYRYINTSDSQLGYHDAEREWLGKIPAIIDDVLNLTPARATAALMMIASLHPAYNLRNAMRTWWHDRHQTSSPNAGQTMSIAAGALDLQLEKNGFYILGRRLPQPQAKDIQRSTQLMHIVVAILVGILILAGIMISMNLL